MVLNARGKKQTSLNIEFNSKKSFYSTRGGSR